MHLTARLGTEVQAPATDTGSRSLASHVGRDGADDFPASDRRGGQKEIGVLDTSHG